MPRHEGGSGSMPPTPTLHQHINTSSLTGSGLRMVQDFVGSLAHATVWA